MPLVPAKCTQCGAILQVDQSKDAAICQHCGAAFVVEKAINNYTVHNHINADTVNVYEQKDFVIRAGVLERYRGEATDVVVPDNVHTIGPHSFANCVGMRSLIIPASVTTICYEAFLGCSRLEHLTLPDTIVAIGTDLDGRPGFCGFLGVFTKCQFAHVRLPAALSVMGRDTIFSACDNLKSIDLPQGLTELPSCFVIHCQNIKTFTIPASISKINSGAFQGKGLSEVTIVNPATIIENDAFISPELTKVNLPPQMITEDLLKRFSKTPWGQSELAKLYRSRNACAHCGGPFKGLFKKFCTKCNKEKDY